MYGSEPDVPGDLWGYCRTHNLQHVVQNASSLCLPPFLHFQKPMNEFLRGRLPFKSSMSNLNISMFMMYGTIHSSFDPCDLSRLSVCSLHI